MGLNVKLYNIISDGSYSVRYKSGNYPYPETIDSTFTFYGSGLTDASITISGLTFDTQYWIKMTDETTGRYIIKNIYSHDSKAFSCYDTICFDVETLCLSPTPTPTPSLIVSSTPTPSVTPTSTPIPSVTPTNTLTPTLTPTPTLPCDDTLIRTLTSNFTRPTDMVYRPTDGNIYFVNLNSTSLTSLIPNTTSTTVINTLPSTAFGYIGYNSTDDKIYTWNGTGGLMITTFTPTITTTTLSIPNVNNLGGNILYSATNGKVYGFSFTGSTAQYNVVSGSTDTLVTTLNNLPFSDKKYGHSLNTTNNSIYGPGTGTTVTVLDCITDTVTNIITIPGTPYATVYNSTSNLIYAIHSSGITVINCSTNTVTTSWTYGFSFSTTCKGVYNTTNGKLYINNLNSGITYVIDASTGLLDKTLTFSGLNSPVGILFYQPTNTIYIANTNITNFGVREICCSSTISVSPTPSPTPTNTPTPSPTPTPTISIEFLEGSICYNYKMSLHPASSSTVCTNIQGGVGSVNYYKSDCDYQTVFVNGNPLGCQVYQDDGVTLIGNGFLSDGCRFWEIVNGIVTSTSAQNCNNASLCCST